MSLLRLESLTQANNTADDWSREANDCEGQSEVSGGT